MSVEPMQFRLYIVRTPLKAVDLWSAEAEELLMLTGATESLLGRYIRQVGGIALGDYQMEAATFFDCNRYLERRPIKHFIPYTNPDMLMYDRAAATIYCRVKYLMAPEPIPASNDIKGLAEYWKQHYNTPLGAGTVEKAMADYEKYVMGK